MKPGKRSSKIFIMFKYSNAVTRNLESTSFSFILVLAFFGMDGLALTKLSSKLKMLIRLITGLIIVYLTYQIFKTGFYADYGLNSKIVMIGTYFELACYVAYCVLALMTNNDTEIYFRMLNELDCIIIKTFKIFPKHISGISSIVWIVLIIVAHSCVNVDALFHKGYFGTSLIAFAGLGMCLELAFCTHLFFLLYRRVVTFTNISYLYWEIFDNDAAIMPDIEGTLEDIILVYIKLFEAAKMLDAITKMQIFFAAANTMLSMSFMLTLWVQELLIGQIVNHLVFFTALAQVTDLLHLWAPSVVCQLIKNKVVTIRDGFAARSASEATRNSKLMRKRISMLATIMNECDLSFSVVGISNLDISFPFKYFSTLFSNVVLAVQFSKFVLKNRG